MGPIGTTLYATGAGFGPSEDVVLRFAGNEGDSLFGTSATTTPFGTFTTSVFSVPPNVAGPVSLVTAHGVTSGADASAPFTVLGPTISAGVATLFGPPDCYNVAGRGFGGQEQVSILYGKTLLASATTDIKGVFHTSFCEPTNLAAGHYAMALAPGEYTVSARTSSAMRCSSVDVTVEAGRYATADIECDTGIR